MASPSSGARTERGRRATHHGRGAVYGRWKYLLLKGRPPAGFVFFSGPGFEARTLAAAAVRIYGAPPVRTRLKHVERDRRGDLAAYLQPSQVPGLRPGTVTMRMLGVSRAGAIFGGGCPDKGTVIRGNHFYAPGFR